MFRKIFNKKAQNTAEYALLIALVVAGVIAMQTYVQRALQARMRDASQYMAAETALTTTNGNARRFDTVQYEPYYQQSNYAVQRTSNETITEQSVDGSVAGVSINEDTDRSRDTGGFQKATYNGTDQTGW